MARIPRRLPFLLKKLFALICIAIPLYVVFSVLISYSKENCSTAIFDTSVESRLKYHSLCKGFLNLHRWENVCGFMVDSLRLSDSFPLRPSKRLLTTTLDITWDEETRNFGERIFGHIHPPSSGYYSFAISSDDTSELWLSCSDRPDNVSLICFVGGRINNKVTRAWTLRGEFNKYSGQVSHDIYLNKEKKYFIEVLHKQGIKLAHLQVNWKLPGSMKFVDISSEFMSPYDVSEYPDRSLPTFKQHQIGTYQPGLYRKVENCSLVKTILQYLRTNNTLLPTCDPSTNKLKLKRYEGLSHVHTVSVYPDDGSTKMIEMCEDPRHKAQCGGNQILDKKQADEIVLKYLGATVSKKYSLYCIIKVEQYKSKKSRFLHYFVDIKILDIESGKIWRVAETFWQDVRTKNLCNPSTYPWASDVTVNVIVTAKNQGAWVTHFIDNLVFLQEANDDHNIHPIIVDFGQKDVAPNSTETYTETYLGKSRLSNYTVIHKTGHFNKTAAINEAAATVKDKNSVLFLLDLHLDLPVDLIDMVRKHTIQGKSAFTPLLMRLSCGSTPSLPVGFWEDQGFGLFAIYNTDWLKFGGMNVKDFGDKWGGEDWDMLDRVITSNIAVQTIRVPGLFHYYHNKDKLWKHAVK